MRLELGHLATGLPGTHLGRVGVVRSEVADGVVAPVVREPPLHQKRLGHVLVHREEFDRRDPEVDQVGQRGGVAQPGVGAAQRGRDTGVGHGEALDMQLVDDGVGVAVARALVCTPLVGRVDDQAARHVAGRVQLARRVGLARAVVEEFGPEADVSSGGAGVRVEQKLGRVAADTARRVIGAGGAVAVGLRRPHPGHEGVPHPRVALEQRDLGLRTRGIEEAQHHVLGHPRCHGEVGAAVDQRRPEGELTAGPGDRRSGSRRSGA